MKLLFVHNLQRLLLRLRGEQAVEAASPAERKWPPPPLQVPGDPDGGGVVGGDVVDDELEVGADGPHELAEEADDPLPPHEGPREHQVLVHAALRDERLHRRQVPPVHAVVELPHHVRRRGQCRRLRPFSCRCGYKNQRRRPRPAAAAREASRSAGEMTAGTMSSTGGCCHSRSRAMLELHRPSVHAARQPCCCQEPYLFSLLLVTRQYLLVGATVSVSYKLVLHCILLRKISITLHIIEKKKKAAQDKWKKKN